MGYWALFTVGVTIVIRVYFFHNVDLSVIGWTVFALVVSWVLNLVVHESLVYHIAWFAVVLLSKTAKKQIKEYGDYDAP